MDPSKTVTTTRKVSGLPKSVHSSMAIRSYMEAILESDGAFRNSSIKVLSIDNIVTYSKSTQADVTFASNAKWNVPLDRRFYGLLLNKNREERNKKKKEGLGNRKNKKDNTWSSDHGRIARESTSITAGGDWNVALLLGQDFHRYLHENDVISKASDRSKAGELFREFLNKQDGNHHKYSVRMESLVMARMREKRLLKSRRIKNGDRVLMTFCNLDGTFPSHSDRQDAAKAIILEKERMEANKNGIAISDAPATDQDDALLAIGETRTIQFAVRCSPGSPPVVLKKAVLDQSRSKAFSIKHPALPLILDGDDDDDDDDRGVVMIEVSTKPKRIGIFRAVLQCHFAMEGGDHADFVITRSIMLKSSGNKELDRLLQPKKPYERVRPRAFERKPKESFNPPKQSRMTDTNNPFSRLSHYNIPDDVKRFMLDHEFETFMRENHWPESEDIQDYSSYWKYLLWALEYQNNLDIQVFDMHEAKLERRGTFFSLHVPGLAEGRPSVLRGDLVHIEWQNKLYKGRVRETRLLDVILELDPSFHRRYNPSLDRVNVRFTFSRMTFRTSHAACSLAPSNLTSLILAPQPEHVQEAISKRGAARATRTVPSSWRWANPYINKEQATAVESIVAGSMRPLPYCIFGPPGTGKTTTVVESVYQLAMLHNLKILLVAPSNDAADLLTMRLATYFPPSELRRILAYSRSIDSVLPAIRDYATEEHASPEAQLAEILRAKIVVSTVNHAARISYFGVPRNHFHVLCIDEAGHATEPEVISVATSLMDFTSGNNGPEQQQQIILAGDPKQLGPVITSQMCKIFGMSVSFLERLMGRREVYGRRADGQYPPELLTKLVRNYRSHAKIIELPNEMFYDNELECWGDQFLTHSHAKWEYLPSKGFPIVFHSLTGENLREGNSPSWFNPQEVQQVLIYVTKLLRETRPPLREEEVGIITPYARQAQKIRLALKSQGFGENIKVGSVETFQGQERRCIIISTVRSEVEHVSDDLRYNLGFVANAKRFNVAITRAQSLLIVIGCAKALSIDKKNWLPFLKFCHENEAWDGEDWDPNDVKEDSSAKSIPSLSQDEHGDWEIIDGPSKAAEQEAAAFINREE